MQYSDTEVIGGLLKGGSTLFGQRVELSWPDGLPPGMTQDQLLSLAEEWAPKGEQPEWIRADAELCHVMVACGKVLASGKCERHGRKVL